MPVFWCSMDLSGTPLRVETPGLCPSYWSSSAWPSWGKTNKTRLRRTSGKQKKVPGIETHGVMIDRSVEIPLGVVKHHIKRLPHLTHLHTEQKMFGSSLF